MSIEAIQAEGLHLKFDDQLTEMSISHEAKLPHVRKDLRDIVDYPDFKRKELRDQFEEAGLKGAELYVAIEDELAQQTAYYLWKVGRLEEIIAFIKEEQELRVEGTIVRNPIGTTYYIDFDNGHDANNDGSTPVKTNGDGPWATLDKFTENARIAGDVCIVRRGMTQIVTSDLLFTSDGTIVAPIIIEADFDDAWGDEATASQTATLTFGSKTVTFAGDISGDIGAHDWIYETTEDNREFAYEVESVSGGSNEIVTLYLPYKGNQAGAGKTIEVMPDNPIWNTAAGNYQINLDADNYWSFQGLHLRGTDTNGVIEMDSCGGLRLKDCILEGNGAGDWGVSGSDDMPFVVLRKTRTYNQAAGLYAQSGSGALYARCWDCLFDSIARAVFAKCWSQIYLYECELDGNNTGDIAVNDYVREPAFVYARDSYLHGTTTEVDQHNDNPFGFVYCEDYDETPSDTRQLTGFSTAEGTPSIQSENATVRAGGSNISIKVTPSDKLASTWDLSRIKIFDLPIYATTSSKTYTVYFKSSAVGNWTADPTNVELWIELEAWGHAVNDHRRIIKSTGVCDFNGDANWVTLTVTVTPAQAGVAYLRCYYCKTKEVGDSNIFYVDPIPVIS